MGSLALPGGHFGLPTLSIAATVNSCSSKVQESGSKANLSGHLWVRGVPAGPLGRVPATRGDQGRAAPCASLQVGSRRGFPRGGWQRGGGWEHAAGPLRARPRRLAGPRGGAGRQLDAAAIYGPFRRAGASSGRPLSRRPHKGAAAAAGPAPAAACTGARAPGRRGPAGHRAPVGAPLRAASARLPAGGGPPRARAACRARGHRRPDRAPGPVAPPPPRAQAPGPARLARPAPPRPGSTHRGPFFPAPRNHMANPRRHSSPRSFRRRMSRNREQSQLCSRLLWMRAGEKKNHLTPRDSQLITNHM